MRFWFLFSLHDFIFGKYHNFGSKDKPTKPPCVILPSFLLVLQLSSYPDFLFSLILAPSFLRPSPTYDTNYPRHFADYRYLASHARQHAYKSTLRQRTSSHPTSSDKIGITSPNCTYSCYVVRLGKKFTFSLFATALLDVPYVTMEALSTAASIDIKGLTNLYIKALKTGMGLLVSMRRAGWALVSQAGGKAHKKWGDECRCRSRWHSLAVRALSWGSGWCTGR